MGKKKLIGVSTGQSAGETIGYANRVVKMTPEKLSYEITANVDDPALPAKHGTGSVDPEIWRQIAGSEELEKLDKIEAVARTPDASDAGEEWIEFEFEEGTQRVAYSSAEPIAELSEMIHALRQVRRNAGENDQ